MADNQQNDPVLSFRVNQRLIDDLEELRPFLKRLPEYQAVKSLSRSALARIAVAHGIERLREVLAQRAADKNQIDLMDSDQEIIDPLEDDDKK